MGKFRGGGVLYYDFFLESKNKKDEYVLQEKIKTENPFVELSLGAGNYRYKIFIYNLLGSLEVESDWILFDVTKAYEPKVRDVSPKIIYLEEAQDGIYTVTGSELRVESEFYLVANEGKSRHSIPGTIIDHDKNNHKVKLQFDVEKIDVSKYSLVVKNPGGLKDKSDKITVKYKKPVDFNVSVGYAPVFILNDDTINKYFEKSFYPLVPNVCLTFIPIKRKFGYLGFALTGSYFMMNNDKGSYSVSSHCVSGSFDLVYQKLLYKRKFLLDVRAGAGVTNLLDMKFAFNNGIVSEPLNSVNISVNAGLGIQYYVLKRLYIEAGCDFTHVFIKDMVMQYIQPVISCGYQF